MDKKELQRALGLGLIGGVLLSVLFFGIILGLNAFANAVGLWESMGIVFGSLFVLGIVLLFKGAIIK